MLGQALMAEARGGGGDPVGVARAGADICFDIGDSHALRRALSETAPQVVINAAALTNLEQCERKPAVAWKINAHAVGVMAEACRETRTRFVHLSTDHYYTGDGVLLHDEAAPVTLVNEYARSKHAAEALALHHPEALVVRTNIAGWRGWPGRPTFLEWLVSAIETDRPITLFSDYYTSTLDARTCAAHVLRLIDLSATGILNVAARDVASKEEFAIALAQALGLNLKQTTRGNVRELQPRRAESLGLDVSHAERLLGLTLPNTRQVITNLLAARH